MFLQIIDDKIVAYSPVAFEGFTHEAECVGYEEYVKEPYKYAFDGETLVVNPDYENLSAQQNKMNEIKEIKAALEELDFKSIRAIRAGETDYMEEYENRAQTLRDRLAELE